MTTQLESHLHDMLAASDRILNGFAPEPLSDDLLEKIPARVGPTPPITEALAPANVPDVPAPIEVHQAAIAYVGKSVKRQTMLGKMFRAIVATGRVSADDLRQDGFITMNDGIEFLRHMVSLGVVHVTMRGAQVIVGGKRYQVSVYSDRHTGGTIPRRRAA